MKKILLTLVLLFATNSFAVSDAEREKAAEVKTKKLLQLEALKNYEADKKVTANEKKLKLQNSNFTFMRSFITRECDPDHGSGSQSCWDLCSKEGYGSTYCADKCGTDSSGGSESCWGACSKEGYGSTYCADKCGTDTGGGSESCWNACSKEGYGSTYCADKCGTDTDSGSTACWTKCSSEGYGSTYCADKCGT